MSNKERELDELKKQIETLTDEWGNIQCHLHQKMKVGEEIELHGPKEGWNYVKSTEVLERYKPTENKSKT